MKKAFYIVGVAALFCACSAANTIPLDDAYIYPENTTPTKTTKTTQTTQTTSTTPTTPSLEVLNAQDTTITVRIRR